jgi:prepilin-type N-terminal cleavage/methylation domain-containing protein
LNRKGFTLVELLVAAALLPAILTLFLGIIKVSAESYQREKVLAQNFFALRSQLEKLRSIPFEQVAQSNGASFLAGAGKIKITPLAADLLKIELRLQPDPLRPPTTLSSLRSSY